MVPVAGLNGLTQARHLGEANQMAREFIAVALDEPLENVNVDVTVVSAGRVTGIDKVLQRSRAERGTAAVLESKTQQDTNDLVRALGSSRRPRAALA